MSISPRPGSGGQRPPRVAPPTAPGGAISKEARHGDAPTGGRPLGRAAQYVRMSTEHQKYSTENQGDAIREYADRHGLGIVSTYADEGKSGLRIDGRNALKRLIADVVSGAADFTTILVYHVRRWGPI